MGFYAIYPPIGGNVPPVGGATSANQVLEIAQLTDINTSAAAINTKTPTVGQKTMAASSPVVIASDQSAIAVTGPLTDSQLRATPVPVSGTVSTGGLTDAQLRATPVPVSGTVAVTGVATETTLAAFSAKSAGSDVIPRYDYRALTYVGATDKINTITYKLGGSGGSTVATQTFGYDGSDRITSITTT